MLQPLPRLLPKPKTRGVAGEVPVRGKKKWKLFKGGTQIRSIYV